MGYCYFNIVTYKVVEFRDFNEFYIVRHPELGEYPVFHVAWCRSVHFMQPDFESKVVSSESCCTSSRYGMLFNEQYAFSLFCQFCPCSQSAQSGTNYNYVIFHISIIIICVVATRESRLHLDTRLAFCYRNGIPFKLLIPVEQIPEGYIVLHRNAAC